jgi:16S rRNA (cytosine1402-N4)-methyltransferase
MAGDAGTGPAHEAPAHEAPAHEAPAHEAPAAPAHVPVLLDRVVELLLPAVSVPGAVVVDCTLGMGGHAEALLAAAPGARLVGLDRDPEALRRSGARLAPYADRVTLVHAVYDELPDVLAGLGIPEAHGVLFDLGVSSLQLDEAARGFAYAQDAPLDMRMDPPGAARPRTSSTPTTARRSPGSSRSTARSASPRASPTPSCGSAPASR